MDPPETRYVGVDDADVAYQVVGEGPFDLLYCFGLGSHIEHTWESPRAAAELSRLASFSRLIFFDRRGLGASDGVPAGAMPTWEEWTEDIAAVLDAAGSKRTAILAGTDAGPIAILFAAMHPEVVSALALFNTTARYLVADDYPIGEPPETVDVLVGLLAKGWGTPEFVRLVQQSDDSEYLRILPRMQRASATPRSAAAQYSYILRRSAIGISAADGSRYRTFDLLIVVGLYLVAAEGFSEHFNRVRRHFGTESKGNPQPNVVGRTSIVFGVVVLVIVTLQVGVGLPEGLSSARAFHYTQVQSARVLANINEYPDQFVSSSLGAYQSAGYIRTMSQVLEHHRLSLFATSALADYRAEGLIALPAASVQITYPRSASVLHGTLYLLAAVSDLFRVTKGSPDV